MTRLRRAMGARLPLVAAVGVLALASACSGGDGDDDSSSKGDAPPSDQPSVAPQDYEVLSACLKDAGLSADVEPDADMGKDTVSFVSVAKLPDEAKAGNASGVQGVDLWVFDDAAAAETHRVDVTGAKADSDAGYVAGRTVVHYYQPVAAGAEVLAQIRTCAESIA